MLMKAATATFILQLQPSCCPRKKTESSVSIQAIIYHRNFLLRLQLNGPPDQN